MARLPRLFIPNCPQHIVQRGNNRQTIFFDNHDHERFLEWLRYAALEQKINVHAYVLMTNHFHLLVSAEESAAVARTMQSLGRRYVQYFNYKYQRTGTLWEGRYRSTSVESEHYLFRCSRYIELNPVRANLVDEPSQYVWSSYRGNIGLTKDPLLTPAALYWNLGNTPFERQAAYRAMVAEGLSTHELEKIRQSTQRAWALGSDRFIQEHSKIMTRPISGRQRGRPRSA